MNPIRTSPDRKAAHLAGQVCRGWRQVRRLFHLLVGMAFLGFAAAGVTVSLAEWRAYIQSPANGIWRFSLLAGFTLILLIFGLYSFIRARSVR